MIFDEWQRDVFLISIGQGCENPVSTSDPEFVVAKNYALLTQFGFEVSPAFGDVIEAYIQVLLKLTISEMI